MAELNLPNNNPHILAEYDQQDRAIISDLKIQEIVEKNMLAALEQCHWKIFGDGGAAKLLGMKPTTLASRIKRLGLSRAPCVIVLVASNFLIRGKKWQQDIAKNLNSRLFRNY